MPMTSKNFSKIVNSKKKKRPRKKKAQPAGPDTTPFEDFMAAFRGDKSKKKNKPKKRKKS